MVEFPHSYPKQPTRGATETSATRADRLSRCERRIGYIFSDKDLLQASLTHASGADNRLASNERLEFLGDAILGAVVCDLLFQRFPNYQEGDLTKIKSVVVSRQTCTKISESLELGEFLIVGKGMAANRQVPPSVLANLFESLLAAIYLDGGNHAARRFVCQYVGPEIELADSEDSGGNYKSLLQQFAQRELNATPVYQLLDEKGPDHAKCFHVCVALGGQRFPGAWGPNKKEAEQKAAQNALVKIDGEPFPFADD